METEKTIAFFNASIDGNFVILEDLLKQDPSVLDATDAREEAFDHQRRCWYPIKGATACIYAAKNGKKECVECLLKAGADTTIKQPGLFGRTALDWAKQNGHTDIERLIMKCNEWLSSQLLAALAELKDCQQRLAEALSQNQTLESKLWVMNEQAARIGSAALWDSLINSGADVLLQDSNRNSLLHIAADSGNTDVCDVLCTRGAEVNHINISGNAALHVAAEFGKTDVCDVLCSRGANVNLANSFGNTPMHAAVFNGKLDVCGVLVKHKADLHLRNAEGHTPLVQACKLGQRDIANFLQQSLKDQITPKFGFYGFKKEALQKVDKFVPFEEALDKQYIELVPDHVLKDNIIFFSHKWLQILFPDDDQNSQFNQLKRVMYHERFSHIIYFWVDFSCVPQSESKKHLQKLAIQSFPHFALRCGTLIALVGSQQGLEKYCNSGWCRLERFTASCPFFDNNSTDCYYYFIEPSIALRRITPLPAHEENPLMGEFHIQADKHYVAPIIRVMCELIIASDFTDRHYRDIAEVIKASAESVVSEDEFRSRST